MPNIPPRPPINRGSASSGEIHPLAGAAALSNYIRIEHGREGVRRFLCAIAPFVSRDFLLALSETVREPAPPPPPPPPIVPERDEKKPSSPNPEELLLLMQALGGAKEGGGLDPKLLLKLMQTQKKD